MLLNMYKDLKNMYYVDLKVINYSKMNVKTQFKTMKISLVAWSISEGRLVDLKQIIKLVRP